MSVASCCIHMRPGALVVILFFILVFLFFFGAQKHCFLVIELVSRKSDFDTWKNVTSAAEQKHEQFTPRATRKLCFSLSEMKLRWGGGHKVLTYLNLRQAD